MLSRTVILALALCGLAALARAAEPTLIHVNTFPNARALPFYVAVEHGFFARHGLNADLQFTKGSTSQRAALASGAADIVHSAVDNALAMIERQG